jgi:hypothetical protein
LDEGGLALASAILPCDPPIYALLRRAPPVLILNRNPVLHR